MCKFWQIIWSREEAFLLASTILTNYSVRIELTSNKNTYCALSNKKLSMWVFSKHPFLPDFVTAKEASVTTCKSLPIFPKTSSSKHSDSVTWTVKHKFSKKTKKIILWEVCHQFLNLIYLIRNVVDALSQNVIFLYLLQCWLKLLLLSGDNARIS